MRQHALQRGLRAPWREVQKFNSLQSTGRRVRAVSEKFINDNDRELAAGVITKRVRIFVGMCDVLELVREVGRAHVPPRLRDILANALWPLSLAVTPGGWDRWSLTLRMRSTPFLFVKTRGHCRWRAEEAISSSALTLWSLAEVGAP